MKSAAVNSAGFTLLWMLIWMSLVTGITQTVLMHSVNHRVIVNAHLKAWEMRHAKVIEIHPLPLASTPAPMKTDPSDNAPIKTSRPRSRSNKKARP